jgi:hypothetical protein
MSLTPLEQQILNQEVLDWLDREQSDLESMWAWPGMAENCLPGVMPDSYQEYLQTLSEEAENIQAGEITVEELRPGVEMDWRDRMYQRQEHLHNLIYWAEDQEITLEAQEEARGMPLPEREANQMKLHRWQLSQDLRSDLEEPKDIAVNREMWMLETLLAEYGHREEWENRLMTLEWEEGQRQDHPLTAESTTEPTLVEDKTETIPKQGE